MVPFYACSVLATPTRAFIPGVSLDMETPMWRLTYGCFEKTVCGIDTLFDDYLDQVLVFVTSAPLRPRLHDASLHPCTHDSTTLRCTHGFMCGYLDTGIPDHNIDQ